MTKITSFTVLCIVFLLSFPFVNVNAQKKSLSVDCRGSVAIQSNIEGAQVYLDGKLVCPSTPGFANIDQRVTMYYGKKKDDEINKEKAVKAHTLIFQFVKNGRVLGTEELKPIIVFDRALGITPYMVCSYPATLAFNYMENEYNEGGVSRSNPGATALEKTIIRWYFESQPQGARIFWRVISSCPDQVKNTNELWLGSTPFEETRSFNIPGLTYENSRDVQIEIKVRKPGFHDQVKRFNVRQAIDQQEISSFFEMVSED